MIAVPVTVLVVEPIWKRASPSTGRGRSTLVAPKPAVYSWLSGKAVAVAIRDLLFDAANRPHLAAHGISLREVRELVALDEWVVTRHTRYPDQVRVIGYTRGGRWRTVAMEPTPDPVRWRPVTGWDSTQEETAYWREQHQ